MTLWSSGCGRTKAHVEAGITHLPIGGLILRTTHSHNVVLGPVMVALSAREEQKPFFRGEALHRDTPVLAPEV